MRPLIEVHGNELGAVVAVYSLRLSPLCCGTSEYVDDLWCFEAEVDLESDALATKGIDYGQEPDLATISEYIVHEIHRPTLVHRRRLGRRFADESRSPAARCLGTYCKPFLAINASNAFDVDLPAFSSKQDINPSLAIAYTDLRDLPDAQPQRDVGIAPDRSVTDRTTIHCENLAGASLTQSPGASDLW
jgi:hypothetical protein